jgi:hypothetical protein
VSAGRETEFFLSESGRTDAAGAPPGDTGGTAAGLGTRRLFGMIATAAGGLGADGGGTSLDSDAATGFAGVVADCAPSVAAPDARIRAAKALIDVMGSP